MRFPLVTLLLLLFLAYDANSLSCHFREAEACVASELVFLSDMNTVHPISEEEIDNRCALGRETDDCLANFTSRCMSPRVREMANFFMRPMRGMRNDICTPGSESRKILLKVTPCLKEVFLSDNIKACLSDVQAALDMLDQETYYTKISPFTWACCVWNRYQECFKPLRDEKCGIAGMREYDNLHVATHLGLIRPDSLCSCADRDECQKILPPSGTKPLGLDSRSPLARLMGTFMFFSFPN